MTTTMTRDSQHRNIQVYFLAAPEDQDVCQAIHKHLSPIVRSSPIPIEVNGDFNIPSGAEREKYKQRLFDADVVLALISSDFINNDDIYSRHQKVIERYNNNETVLVPILVRNCLWKSTPFARLPVLPKNLQPLNNKQFWNSQDDALTAVVSDIYDSINELTHIEAIQPSSTAEVASAPDPRDVSSTLTSQTRAASPVNIEWRKKYYREVLKKRAGAILLDQFFLFLVPFVLLGIVAGIMEAMIGTTVLEDPPVLQIVLVMYFVVAPIMESSQWRGSIGKRILKLQITDREGNRISFFRAVWRNIIRTIVLYSYILVVPLVIQYFRFNKTKKLLHDELSSTVIGEKLASSGAASVAGSAA